MYLLVLAIVRNLIYMKNLLTFISNTLNLKLTERSIPLEPQQKPAHLWRQYCLYACANWIPVWFQQALLGRDVVHMWQYYPHKSFFDKWFYQIISLLLFVTLKKPNLTTRCLHVVICPFFLIKGLLCDSQFLEVPCICKCSGSAWTPAC